MTAVGANTLVLYSVYNVHTVEEKKNVEIKTNTKSNEKFFIFFCSNKSLNL